MLHWAEFRFVAVGVAGLVGACAGAAAHRPRLTQSAAPQSPAPAECAAVTAGLTPVGPAAALVDALRDNDVGRAESAVGDLRRAAEAEASMFHTAGPDASKLRAFFETWVYAQTPTLQVGLDRFELHRDLALALAVAAARHEDWDAARAWMPDSVSPRPAHTVCGQWLQAQL